MQHSSSTFIDFGSVELTIRISVVMQPLNFSSLIGCKVQISKSAWIRTSFNLDISEVVLNVSAHLSTFFVKPTVFTTIINFIIALIWSNTFKCPGVDRGSSSSLSYILLYFEFWKQYVYKCKIAVCIQLWCDKKV